MRVCVCTYSIKFISTLCTFIGWHSETLCTVRNVQCGKVVKEGNDNLYVCVSVLIVDDDDVQIALQGLDDLYGF